MNVAHRSCFFPALVAVLASVSACDQPSLHPADRDTVRLAPELEGGLVWINSEPLKLADLRGQVVLIDFFEYNCINCLRTLPYLKEWQRRYLDKGLVMIGIHSPQYGFSMDPQNVYAAVKRLDLTYPIIVDSDFAIAKAYDNRFWPRTLLVDAQGTIRFDHIGEGAYQQTEELIQELLREVSPGLQLPPVMEPLRATDREGAVCFTTTPELYLGHLRGRVANQESAIKTDHGHYYRLPVEVKQDLVYVHGEWNEQDEYLRHTRDTSELEDYLLLRYHATEVHMVMRPEQNYWMEIFVKQDDRWVDRSVAGRDVLYDEQGRSYVKVDQPRMYTLISGQPYGVHDLQIYAKGKGLSVYSIGFGTCVIPDNVDRLLPAKELP